MALDKLVDSTQLDADLTSVANAIRAKSGGSSQLAFPAGFVSEIQAIPSGGGGNSLESDFLIIRKETIEVGENTVTNSNQLHTYLKTIKSIPGELFAISSHKKTSYSNNEYANGHVVGTAPQGFRFKNNAWTKTTYNNVQFDATIVSGSFYDVYTYELIDPRNV